MLLAEVEDQECVPCWQHLVQDPSVVAKPTECLFAHHGIDARDPALDAPHVPRVAQALLAVSIRVQPVDGPRLDLCE
eukprot:32837-Lingulodinium_polyedra.AAC.1